MKALLLGLVLLLGLAAPASAHRLKLFATVDDGALTGYAFFIGGGRPEQAEVIVRDGSGQEVFRGRTGDQGEFSWRPPQAGDFTVTVDARDGHVAEARVPADRFAGGAPEAEAAPAAAAGGGACAALDRTVDRAVSRQVRPLLEAYDAADGRVRLNDVAGGIGMIVGLAGIALWARGRRPPPGR